MGNELSNSNITRNDRSNPPRPPQPQQPQTSEAAVKRLLEIQRHQYERKLQELAAKTAAQNSAHERKLEEIVAKTAAQNSAHERKLQEVSAKTAAQNSAQERKLQEVSAKTAAQNSTPQKTTSVERNRVPYSYTYSQLQQTVASAPPASVPAPAPYKPVLPLYPNLNQSPSSSGNKQNNNNNPYRPPPQEFAFVNNYGQTQRPQTSEAAEKRLLEIQRQQYERKLQELAANTAAQNSADERKLEEIFAKIAAQNSAHERKLEEIVAKTAAQNSAHERKLQEMAAKTAAQNSTQTPQTTTSNRPVGPAPSAPPAPSPPLGPAQRPCSVSRYRPPGPPSSAPPAPSPPRGPAQRPRSVSRPRNEPTERDVFHCPTCDMRYGMRIFQCDNGHSSCNECKIRGRACGICRGVLTNRRNYGMESHIAQMKVPCPHANEGCKLFIKLADMEAHVKKCPFKEQDCPLAAIFGTCRWKGKISQISSHFDNMHPSGRQADVDSEMQLTNFRNNSQQVHLVVLGVYNFLFHLKVSETDGKIYMAVQQLVGTKTSAMKWLYEIHVYNKSENRRKYMYTDNCCSSSDIMDDVFRAGECAVLPVWYAATFVCNEALNFKFFIKKSNDERNNYGKFQRGKESLR